MKFQAPRGTRDFYPQDMAWHRHLVDAWRRVSIRHGFEQVEGPVYEYLDLYKVKSGEGIVSELFHFEDRGGRQLAIRPEFTPTLARMVAQKASALPRPIKWFATPNLCRAERPQRGRLREHWQWNIDLLGIESALADAEIILTAIDFLREMGLGPEHVRVKLSHREVVQLMLSRLGVPDEKMAEAFNLLDRRDKMSAEAFTEAAMGLGLSKSRVDRLEQMCRRKYRSGDVDHLRRSIAIDHHLTALEQLDEHLTAFGVAEWCEYDLGIVRGLAYYTGTVFEIHEAAGVERAVAGGGRYDNLIELFGGPSIPAVGLGMGDVVLTHVLRDKGLVPDDVIPRADVFVFASSDAAARELPRVVAGLRAAGWHVRFSYKATRNVGKLLKDADAARARYALILEEGGAQLKELASGEQGPVALSEVHDRLRAEAAGAIGS